MIFRVGVRFNSLYNNEKHIYRLFEQHPFTYYRTLAHTHSFVGQVEWLMSLSYISFFHFAELLFQVSVRQDPSN